MENGRNAFYVPGQFDVYVGAMYTEKTSYMLLQLLKSRLAGVPVQVFKPTTDIRDNDPYHVTSRNGFSIESTPILSDHPEGILGLLLPETEIVGMDEAQFFAPGIVDVVHRLRREGRHVVAAMLDLDFAGRPFGSAGPLLAAADAPHKMYGVCMVPGCKDRGTRTQRFLHGKPAPPSDPIIVAQVPGDTTRTYELRCFFHHEVPDA